MPSRPRETESDNPVLQLESLTKFYGKRLALDDISLSVSTGVTGLLGPNGCGKSTMIKSVLGLLKIQRGKAWVLGHQLPKGIRAIRDAVGYVPEDDCFIAGLTGIESVCFMSRLSGLPAVEGLRRSHEALDFADMGQERYRNVETYSTGMRQKLKFAQAIVHDPSLLILDEPTSGLDPAQRVSLLKKIRTLADQHGKSVIICTHILHDVKSVCDQVVIMAAGRIKLVDSLENLSRPSRSGMLVRVEPMIGTTHASDGASEEEPTKVFANAISSAGYEFEMQQDKSVWIHGVEAEGINEIWEAARSCEVNVRKLLPATNSLEEIFFNSVKEAEHATA